VGHPLVDIVRPTMTRAEFAARHGLNAGQPIVALLPGSRPSEIERHYLTLLEACRVITREMKPAGRVQFVDVAASGLSRGVQSRGEADAGVEVKRVEGGAYDALAAADCAIVASGTATVEAALLGTPLVVIYRVAPLTALLLRRMVHTPFFGMVNLIAGRRVAPELVQDDFTPAAVAREVCRLLSSQAARDEMKAGLAEVGSKLGPGGAIERAADIFARMLERPRSNGES